MLNRRVFGIIAAAAPLAACVDPAMSRNPATGAINPPPEAPLAAATGSPAGLMLQAAQGGTFLLQTAQLGQGRARSGPLREFCGFELAEQEGLMQAMSLLTGGNPPRPGLLPPQQQVLSGLQSASAGPNFDRLLVDAQLNGHRDALGVFNNIAANTGEAPGMRALAIAAIGHIREHIAVLERGLVRGRV